MTELSHGKLERFHYEALKNPAYQTEGMMDVLREELFMNMPVSSERPIEQRPEPTWTGKQWDIVTQIRDEVRGWRDKHYQLLKEIEGMRAISKGKYVIKE